MTILLTTSGPLAPAQITILEWVKALRSVTFSVATTVRTQLVTLRATLKGADGTTHIASVRTLDPHLVTGMCIPLASAGTYALSVALMTTSGVVEASASRSAVVVR